MIYTWYFIPGQLNPQSYYSAISCSLLSTWYPCPLYSQAVLVQTLLIDREVLQNEFQRLPTNGTTKK